MESCAGALSVMHDVMKEATKKEASRRLTRLDEPVEATKKERFEHDVVKRRRWSATAQKTQENCHQDNKSNDYEPYSSTLSSSPKYPCRKNWPFPKGTNGVYYEWSW